MTQVAQLEANQNAAKRIRLMRCGGQAPEFLELLPGTTGRDVFQHLRLGSGYELSINEGALMLGPDDNIYRRVEDGSDVWITAAVDAGA